MTLLKNSFSKISLAAIALLLSCALLAQSTSDNWRYELPQEIHRAINANKTEDILPLLNDFVEVTTPFSNGVFSRRQAEVVMLEFFNKVRIKSFKIDHERTMGEVSLTIGSLITHDTSYHIYILTKRGAEKTSIQQIKIEEK